MRSLDIHQLSVRMDRISFRETDFILNCNYKINEQCQHIDFFFQYENYGCRTIKFNFYIIGTRAHENIVIYHFDASIVFNIWTKINGISGDLFFPNLPYRLVILEHSSLWIKVGDKTVSTWFRDWVTIFTSHPMQSLIYFNLTEIMMIVLLWRNGRLTQL